MKPPGPARTRRSESTCRRHTVLFALLALALQSLLCQHAARAQHQEIDPSEEDVYKITTDLILVPFYVTDGGGRRVPGLSEHDFQVRDNGRPVEKSFLVAGAESVGLLFLLDASGSTREIVTAQSETALALFSHFGARSHVAVMQFRERAELAQDFTRDLRAARKAFQIASLPDRRTAIFDAARDAVRAFRAPGRSTSERRIVVLVSDGLDTASTSAPASVIAEANAAGVSFYVIHLPLYAPAGGRLAARKPSKGFRELAEQTGGKFFVVGDARSSLDPHAEQDLSPIFRAIAEDLQSQYVLGYHTGTVAEPGTHRVEVRLNAPRDRKLRVRQLRETYEPKR
jgi:Ca-activated chloride channel family protein